MTTPRIIVQAQEFVARVVARGLRGERGQGVIPGGAQGQILGKRSDDDYDTEWLNPGDAPSLVNSVAATAPITSTGGVNPVVGITPATSSAPGSMSAADKAKLDNLLLSSAPPAVAASSQAGASTRAAREDHTHAHGAQGGGTLHANASGGLGGSAGFMSVADKNKLDGIQAGAQVNVATNLGIGGTGNARQITSSTGAAATLPIVTQVNAGVMSVEDKAKLDGISPGATVYTNALARGQVELMLVAGSNVTFSYAGSGASRTLTINASGGGGSGSPGGPDRSIQFNNAGAFAGSEQLTWSADFTGLVVPAVYGFDRVFVTGVIDPEVGTAAVATETMAVSEVEGVASWQLQLRSRDGGGLVRMRLRSDDVGPQIAFGSGDFVGFWHAENFDPTQGPEVETVAGTTYDFVNSDSGKYKRATATGAKTFVVDATVTKLRWECDVRNAAASGDLTIAGDGVTINGVADGSVSLPPGASAVLRRVSSGVFDVLTSSAAAGSAVRPITVGWDGGRVNGVDQALTTGLRFELRAVTGLTPVEWTLLPKAGSTGDITVEVRKRPFASGTFTAITDGSPPSIASGARGTGSAAAWDAINDGDLIEIEVTSVTGTVTGITLIIEATEA